MPRIKPRNTPDDEAKNRIRRVLESKTNYRSQSSSSPSQNVKNYDSESSDEEEANGSDTTVVLDSSSDETAQISPAKKKNSPAHKKTSPAESKTKKTSQAHSNESQESCLYTDKNGNKKRRYRPGK